MNYDDFVILTANIDAIHDALVDDEMPDLVHDDLAHIDEDEVIEVE